MGEAVGKTSRLTVSVPSSLLEAVDRLLVNGGESRSAVVRRLLETAVRDAQEQEAEQRWKQSYEENPQTEEEFGWAEHAARQLLSEVAWK